MKTNELYDYLLSNESIVVTLRTEEDLVTIKRRLIKKRQREQRKLGEFADKSKQLRFDVITKEGEEPVKVTISIVERSKELPITDVQPAGEF